MPKSPQMPGVAVVGCGKWGKNLARNFHQLGHLSAICDMREDVLAELRELYPEVRVTQRFDSLLEDPLVSGIVISTPSKTHYPLAKQVLNHQKHLYVEKPAATKVVHIQELFRLAEHQELVLMVGHLLLYHPVVNRLKQLIESGYLGEITYIQSDRLNYNPHRSDINVMWDLAPHDLSMVSYLLGMDPERVVSVTGHRTSSDGLVDVAHLEVLFPNGISGHIHTSWVHPSKQVKLMVRGTLRSAILDDTVAEHKLQIFPTDPSAQTAPEYPEYLLIEPLKLECEHFINSMKMGKSPNTDGLNGLRVVRILEEADGMMKEMGTVSL